MLILLLVIGLCILSSGLRLNPTSLGNDGPIRFERKRITEEQRNHRLEQWRKQSAILAKATGPSERLVALRDKMQGMRNESVNPCEDFFEYACGGWIAANPEESLPAAFATADALYGTNEFELFKELASNQNFFASKLHQQCLRDLPAILEAKRNPYVASLFQDIQKISKETFGNVVGQLAIHEIHAFFEWESPTTWILNASTDYHLPLAPSYISDNQWTYYEIGDALSEAAELYGKDFLPPGKTAKNATDGAYRVWKYLYEQYSASEKRFQDAGKNVTELLSNRLLESYDLNTLQKRAPLPWSSIFQTLGISQANDFIVYDSNYFANISTFLQRSLSIESAREDLSYFLSYKLYSEFDGFALRDPSKGNVTELCVQAYGVYGFLEFPYYTKRFVDSKLSNAIEDLLKEVIFQFEKNLPNISWLDEPTRAAALLKAQMFGINIGGPSLVDFPLPTITLKENYFLSFFDAIKVIKSGLLRRVSTPVDRNHEAWSFSVFSESPVNAFYEPNQNGIFIQAPIMFPDFFDPLNPLFSQYAGIGTVLGHEMSHGFDNSGSQFDEYGTYRDWWSKTAKAEFNKVKQCIIDFYTNTSYHTEYHGGGKLNGKLTQGENIADFGGLKFSYMAWKQALKDGKGLYPESEIKQVFNRNSDQLFFETYAQLWCANPPDEVTRDVHSTSPMRVLGPLSHFAPFQQAYGCKPGDVYYSSPCIIW